MWSLANKLINLNALPYNQLQLPSNVSSGIFHGEKVHLVMRSWFVAASVTMMNFCANATNPNAKVPNSIAKPTNSITNRPNSIAKVMNSTANGMKSIAKVMNSTANGMKSIAKLTNSIAKTCK